jgi:hypothetical protein
MAETGPPYPPLPGPGSNAISHLAIGSGQIGDIAEFDWWQTIISQYANSSRLTGIIGNIAGYLDQTANLDAFFDLIWNVNTAEGYGLDIWGRIVGVGRNLQILPGDWLGFEEAQPGSDPFNDAGPVTFTPGFGFDEGDGGSFGENSFGLVATFGTGFLTGGSFFSSYTLPTNYRLLDEDYRTLIFAKAAANITDGSIPAINQILMGLFPNRGNCYVTDCPMPQSYLGFAEALYTSRSFNSPKNVSQTSGIGFEEADGAPFGTQPFGVFTTYGDSNNTGGFFYSGTPDPRMTLTYTFEFQLTPVELAIIKQSGVLPKPVGVAATVVIR